MSAVLDTHTVIWYLEDSQELSSPARTAIEDAIRDARDVHVSAISMIEVVYLVERKRVPATALKRLRDALTDPNAGVFVAPVDALVADALERIPRSIVPDMPDRIIAATSPRRATDHPRSPPPSGRNSDDLVRLLLGLLPPNVLRQLSDDVEFCFVG